MTLSLLWSAFWRHRKKTRVSKFRKRKVETKWNFFSDRHHFPPAIWKISVFFKINNLVHQLEFSVKTTHTQKKSWKVRFWNQRRKSVVISNLKSRSQIAGAKWCLCLKKFNFVSTFRFQSSETTEPFLGFYNSKNLLALDLALKTCWRKIVDSKWHSVCFGQLFGDIEKKLESLSFENGK